MPLSKTTADDWLPWPVDSPTDDAPLVVGDSPMIDPTWIQAGSQVLGAALSPSGAPSRADSSAYASFDNSGFAVNFGSGGISQTQPLSMWILAGVGLLVLVWMKRKK